MGVVYEVEDTVSSKTMRVIALCEGELAVFYQGDVIGLVENQC